MAKKAEKEELAALEAEMEKRMKPLVDAAGTDARHFVAKVMHSFLTVQERYASQQEADAAAKKALDEMYDAFCKAQCSAWRMMFAQMIEDGVINPDVISGGFGGPKPRQTRR